MNLKLANVSLLFTIVLVVTAYSSPATDVASLSSGKKSPYPYQTFKSTNATAPVLKTENYGGRLAKGLLFLAPEVPYSSGLIMNPNDGEPVWCGPLEAVSDVRVQQLHGKSVLTRWTGRVVSDYSYGQVTIMDTSYTVQHIVCPKLNLFSTVKPQPKCDGDIHESTITDRGTLLVTAYNVTKADLSSIGGPKHGWILDGLFFEIDIKTNKILFHWSAIAHVPVKNTEEGLQGQGKTKKGPFDFFHINSVQRLPGGQYLISSRFTSTIYLISPKGNIMWEFNGKTGGDFGRLPDNAKFSYQHDARASNITSTSLTLSLFNNHNLPAGSNSNGLSFHLNTAKHTSTLLRKLHYPPHAVFASSQGSYQPLPNGNVLLAYGAVPQIIEYGPSGDTDARMRIHYSNNTGTGTYRAYKLHWHAVPAARPDVAVSKGMAKGWVSWNGATDVSGYAIYSGTSKQRLKKTAHVKKSGFETEFKLPGGKPRYLQVGAFEDGRLLRKSEIVKIA